MINFFMIIFDFSLHCKYKTGNTVYLGNHDETPFWRDEMPFWDDETGFFEFLSWGNLAIFGLFFWVILSNPKKTPT